MAARALRTDETVALAGAAALHVALIAVLLMQPEKRDIQPEPERVTVNLSEEVGLTSTAPDPVPESRAAQAPTLSDLPLVAPPLPIPLPEVLQPTPPRPQPTAAARPTPAPRPSPARTSTPRPRPSQAARPSPAPSPARARPSPAPSPARAGGASRVGSDFLAGAGSSASSSETRVPASQIGASTKASLLGKIVSEVRPRFDPPSGVEVDKLVSVVRFRLNADGSLNGRPSLVSQRGETDANRPQAGRHAEQAIRAVVLAAPFDLPSEYHEAFKTVTLNFDASL